MRKLLSSMIALLMAMSVNAQYLNDPEPVFNQGKLYLNASLSNLGLSYNQETKFRFGMNATAGYMFVKDCLLYGTLGIETAHEADPYIFLTGGMRYYFEQNGIFIGADANYVHAYGSFNDVFPGVHVGYAYFLSRTVAIEPMIIYNQSFKKHSDFSGLGFQLGFGIYL